MLKKYALLVFFILLKFLIQFNLVNPIYNLQRDEYLHIDQGRHLAAGFLSVPPLTSLQSWLILQLGNTDFWVRFFPAMYGALTIAVVWKAIEALNAGIFAQVLAGSILLFSSLLRLNILYQPNSFDVLAWTFIYYCILRYCNTEHKKWIWFAALAFAAGFLNKYNNIFQIIGLLPALLLTRQRSIFSQRALYFAAIAAFLLIAPNLYWQYSNGFPVFYHMRELTSTQLVHVSRADFLEDQLFFFFGGILVLIAGFISLFVYDPFKKYLVLFYALFFTLLLFIFLRAKSYYAIGLYPIFLAFGAAWIEKILHKPLARWTVWPLLVLLPPALFALVYKKDFPVLPPEKIVAQASEKTGAGMHKWEDGKEHPISQDFADMLGWKELASIVDSAYDKMPDKENTVIFCDNYGQAGAVNYYTNHKNLQAISANADYINWIPKNIQWKNIIRVTEKENTTISKEKQYFDSIVIAGYIKNPFAREQGTTVYQMMNATDSVKIIVEAALQKVRNKYRE